MTTPGTQPDTQEGLPLILTVRFAPNNLPSGMVAAQDMANFLEGMQLALNGLIEYDIEEGTGDTEQSRFIISALRPGSLECDVILNFFINLPDLPSFITQTGGIAGWIATTAASAFIYDMMANTGRPIREKAGRRLKKLMDSLKHITSADTHTDTQQVPSALLQKLQPGLLQMAETGAKPEYQPAGITITDKVTSGKTALFNVETQARIERLLKEKLETTEVISVQGFIRAMSSIDHNFQLVEASGKRGGTIRHICQYNDSEDARIRTLYAEGRRILVLGLRHTKLHASSHNRIIEVLEIEVQPSLFDEDQHTIN